MGKDILPASIAASVQIPAATEKATSNFVDSEHQPVEWSCTQRVACMALWVAQQWDLPSLGNSIEIGGRELDGSFDNGHVPV